MRTLVAKTAVVNSIGLLMKLDLPFQAMIRKGMDSSSITDPAERMTFESEVKKEGYMIEIVAGLSSLWVRCDEQVTGPAKILYLECVSAKTKTKGLAFRPVRLIAVDVDGDGHRVELSKPRGGTLTPEEDDTTPAASKPATVQGTAQKR